MADRPQPKHWRPRFSLRTLFVLVTLTCVYFAAWEATKKFGLGHPTKVHGRLKKREWTVVADGSMLPFFVWREEYVSFRNGFADPGYRRYNIWLFGSEFELPYERKLVYSDGIPSGTTLYDHPFEPGRVWD